MRHGAVQARASCTHQQHPYPASAVIELGSAGGGQQGEVASEPSTASNGVSGNGAHGDGGEAEVNAPDLTLDVSTTLRRLPAGSDALAHGGSSAAPPAVGSKRQRRAAAAAAEGGSGGGAAIPTASADGSCAIENGPAVGELVEAADDDMEAEVDSAEPQVSGASNTVPSVEASTAQLDAVDQRNSNRGGGEGGKRRGARKPKGGGPSRGAVESTAGRSVV